MSDADEVFEDAFTKVVELGNRTADENPDEEVWDVADGVLAGAIQYWLFSRQPCGDPRCEDCAPISTAEGRMAELAKLMREFAEDSEYYHSPKDTNVGRA